MPILSQRLIRQSRANSALGFFGGLVFVGIGIFIAIPTFGVFGIFWTLLAGGIAAYHGYGFLSKKGVSVYEVEASYTSETRRSLSDRLGEVEEARRMGRLTDSEYTTLRNRILADE